MVSKNTHSVRNNITFHICKPSYSSGVWISDIQILDLIYGFVKYRMRLIMLLIVKTIEFRIYPSKLGLYVPKRWSIHTRWSGFIEWVFWHLKVNRSSAKLFTSVILRPLWDLLDRNSQFVEYKLYIYFLINHYNNKYKYNIIYICIKNLILIVDKRDGPI